MTGDHHARLPDRCLVDVYTTAQKGTNRVQQRASVELARYGCFLLGLRENLLSHVSLRQRYDDAHQPPGPRWFTTPSPSDTPRLVEATEKAGREPTPTRSTRACSPVRASSSRLLLADRVLDDDDVATCLPGARRRNRCIDLIEGIRRCDEFVEV